MKSRAARVLYSRVARYTKYSSDVSMQSMPTKVRLEATEISRGASVFTLSRYDSVITPAKNADQPRALPTFSSLRNVFAAK